ncbi:methionine/alanine import family NSS transporter small subunit [Priestia flexa]|jgi:Putative methionine and alanine importer, small subunit|uniref:Methionine/alanine import family NSS transporter small subunit n=1 Tax=Priestia flexa TaxID=86664 RepID=A0A1N6PQR0_9BACI|nr:MULTISPECIES: methionine/alanine import family NSS transporter small subunit [Bacillaceae]MBN8253088.1 methionine/alanine import family NSS transporter small subunit [Priestia flexa]MBN8433727.1 methionine/alanine import family NSS transporter small subunit [Priestia flexa]MBY6086901.1 methionine/alanine import family NSS transporter small subunit [Priestia flexa]MCA0966015.1 methionine/alanine import family NSS transporter small subunit [Priestia flexa]MCA1202504.1 methionine/alanine impor
MESNSVIMMIAGMIIIWGGLAASIIHAVKKSKESKA